MIVLFTDFGVSSPYVGQMKNVLLQQAPGVTLLDLLHNAPAFSPELAAYLLAAYVDEFPRDTVFLCVVDPGVGTQAREPVVMKADGRWFVGPGNGLFKVIQQRARGWEQWRITWQPQHLSNSFHGRDLFAPVAAQLVRGSTPQWQALPLTEPNEPWPEELYRCIYSDDFGNVMTGLRSRNIDPATVFRIKEFDLRYARTFGEQAAGTPFWYGNANGLVEFAVSCGSAAAELGITIGDSFETKKSIPA